MVEKPRGLCWGHYTARRAKKELTFHPEVLVELYGMEETIRGLGGLEKILNKLLTKLSPKERQEMKRRL